MTIKADLWLVRENAYLGFFNEKKVEDSFNLDKYPHKDIWLFCVNFLKEKGFRLYTSQKFLRDYQSIAYLRRWGTKKNGLKFQSEIYPTGFKIQFYQDKVKENKCGGYYDFEKYKKMPQPLKVSFNRTVDLLIRTLQHKFNLTFHDRSDLQFPRLTAKQQIIKHFQESSFTRDTIEDLGQLDKYMTDSDIKCNSKDKNGNILHNGDIKHFKDYNGKIRKGQVFHNINNMWWVVQSKYKLRNIANFDIW